MTTSRERRARKAIRTKLAYHLTGITISIFFLAPFVITLLSSFRHGTEASLPPLPPWPTSGVSIDSYALLDTFGAGIWRHMINSLFVSVATVVLTVAVSLLAGYGFSRYRFPLKNALFV
ncbi:carbohydrate ABC transporter permease, partial [Rhizobium ruizarguesonis]